VAELTTFTTEQRAGLRELAGVWGGTSFCLIGAAAALAWRIDLRRSTNDLDISVSISVDEITATLAKLKGWRQDPRREHEWLAPGDIKVDVVPAGPTLLAAGYIVWPVSGRRMTLTGLRLAFTEGVPLEIEPDLFVRVAPIPVIALLKTISYQDRPYERERDLQDLTSMLDGYVPPDDERRFAPDVVEARIDYEHASSYLLGRDLGRLVNDQERGAVQRFIERAFDDHDGWTTQARMARLAPRSWNGDPDQLLARIGAFRAGFGGS